MKKIIAIVLALAMVLSLAACGAKTEAPAADAPAAEAPAEKKVAGFVTFGLGGDFFQQLADLFVSTFEQAGWEASYADGEFNPAKQIEAAENYIAQGVDVLFICTVAQGSTDAVVKTAQDAGIKVIAFVQATDTYDALMISDEVALADDLNRLAAKWIDDHFADAEDHSVPVAAFTCRAAETGKLQGDEMLKIAEFSKKAVLAAEVECADESQDTGLSKMENLYTTNPEIKVFITPHNGLAMGVNNYFTGLGSPVTDYTDMGVFAVNATEALDIIGSSLGGESPFRGTVMTGGPADTANSMLFVASGIMDGSLPAGHVQKAGTVFAYANPNTNNLDVVTGELPQ